MKTITLTQIRLLNFKGMRDKTIDFAPGVTEILGKNGSGKTTVFDAFTWVLFGKDSSDRKQFDIKTLDADGAAIPRLPHEVTITLDINGEKITLTRRYVEVWSKKRGAATEEFVGHEETRLYNDVPCNLKEWNEKIVSICPEEVFKFITNPDYFTAQNRDAQRALLIRMAGGVTNEEIAEGNAEFTQLIARLTGKTLEEYQREIKAKKAVIKRELDDIPGRIDERNRDIEDDVDYAAVRKELDEKIAAIASIDSQLADISKGMQAAVKKRQEVITKHTAVGMKISALEYEIISEIEKQHRQELKRYNEMRNELTAAEYTLEKWQRKTETEESELKEMQTRRASLIEEYRAIMAETFKFSTSDFVCPTCGRPLEVADIEKKKIELLNLFNTSKAQKIARNKAKGVAVSKDTIAEKEAKISDNKSTIAEFSERVEKMKQQLQNTPEPTMPDATPAIKANLKWQELKRQENEIAALIAQPIVVPGDDDRAELIENKKLLQEGVAKLQSVLAKEQTRLQNRERIKELENRLRSLSQELAELEKSEYDITTFSKAKINFIESKINSLFSIVTFKMYDRLINGGEVEKCEAMINGVPFSSANSASRINAGLDIINAICKFQGVCAPVFIDNAESVNTILPTESQQIRLTVTDDDKLVVKTESKKQ